MIKNIIPKTRLAPLSVFVISMVIYTITLAPTVTGEDSGELIAAAFGNGVAHPPGYPLWTLLASLSIKLIPIGQIAYRVNMLSALLGSASAAVLCMILQRFFSVRYITAIATSLCFAFGRHLWSQAVIAEVYTLHVLLFCLILYFTLLWRHSKRNRDIYIVSFLVGLGLTNHHLTVLLGPVLLITVLATKPKLFLSPKTVLLCLLFLAIGLLPYLYLPIAANQHPYLNWGDPSSWQSFSSHVLRQQYGDDSMHTSHSLHRSLGHLGVLWQWNTIQYTIAAVPIIIAGAFSLARQQRDMFYFTLGLFVIHTIGLAEILNFSFQRQEIFCVRVFMLPAYVITAMWLAIGAEGISQAISSRIHATNLRSLPCYLLTPILVIAVVFSNYPDNNMSHYYYAYDHARNILDSLEDNAMIIPSGDHNTFPLIYCHYVEGIRPDITIADKYGYIEYNLYKDMPNAPIRIRTELQRKEIEAYLIKHSGRPVYYTVQPQFDLIPEYRAASFGMLFQIYHKDSKLSYQKLPSYHYRNIAETPTVIDHAASVILSDYHFHLAANALRKNEIKTALLHIDRAAQLSKGLKEEINNIGTLLAEFRMDDLAIGYYEQAAKLDPHYLTPRWNLAQLFKARRNIIPAIQVFNDIARLEPKNYRPFGELGFLLYQHGDINLAITNWAKSLALNPNQPQILNAIAKLTKN